MKNLFFQIILTVFTSVYAIAQNSTDVQYVNNLFSGSKIFYSWQWNGSNIWSNFYEEHHYCPSGYLHIRGVKETTTAYTDTSREEYTNRGVWKIIKDQGQIYLNIIWENGNVLTYAIDLLQGGTIRFQNGINFQYQGRAHCY